MYCVTISYILCHLIIYIHNGIQEENKGCSITYIRLLALPRTGTKTLHIRFPAGQSHARMHGPDAYTGESIYQHAHIYKRGFTSVRSPGIRLAVDGKARGRLVSAQLWRHPSHAHILQGSRDQPWPSLRLQAATATPCSSPRPAARC
jgi:hypothetical protein